MKKFLICLLICCGALQAATATVDLFLDKTWNIESHDEKGWIASRETNKNCEYIEVEIKPRSKFPAKAIQEFISFETSMLLKEGNHSTVHLVSSSEAVMSWQKEHKCEWHNGKWKEWSVGKVMLTDKHYAFITYSFLGQSLKDCDTQHWVDLFTKDLKLVEQKK